MFSPLFLVKMRMHSFGKIKCAVLHHGMACMDFQDGIFQNLQVRYVAFVGLFDY